MSVLATRQIDSPSEAVIDAVADREGVDPTELTVPLYEAIDPDALDAIVQTGPEADPSLRVEFDYYGYAVVVTGDGSVRVADSR